MPATWMRTPLGGTMPGGLAMEVLARGDQPLRDHLIAQDVLLAVDVGQEQLQRGDPLFDPALELAHSAAAITRGTRSSGNGRS